MNKVIAESVKYGNKRNMKFQLFFSQAKTLEAPWYKRKCELPKILRW